MNYIQQLAEAIKMRLPDELRIDSHDKDDLFYIYASLLLAKGTSVTTEDVHNSWSAWMTSRDTSHPSLKPFADLPRSTKQADEPFAKAIIECGTNPRVGADIKPVRKRYKIIWHEVIEELRLWAEILGHLKVIYDARASPVGSFD